jgi:excinuclease ABC subunit C
VMFVRGGMLIGRRDFFLEGVGDLSLDELYSSFIQQFYAKEGMIPRQILLPVKLKERELLERFLSDKRGGSVRLYSPSRGQNAQLLRLAQENAALRLQEQLGMQRQGTQVLSELQGLLHLRKLPRRIEAFDISNIMGDQAVGSMVVCDTQGMKKSDYRKFKIRTVQGANDFAMLQEVLYRRYSKIQETPERIPDLILIDGGKGQLSAAIEVLERLNLHEVDIFGLAKARDEKEERVFLPGAPEAIQLPPASAAMHLLQRIRDEAHRFAVTYHRKLRGQEMISSMLDEIDGIGETRKRALLRHFGSLDRIRHATLEDLEKVSELGRPLARRLFNLFSAKEKP